MTSSTAAGALTLLGNHEVLVGITATTACTPFVSASASTAPNLKVGFRGVDLGTNDALQFTDSGNQVAVPVMVNAEGVKLTSFQIVVSFDSSLLLATTYSEGVNSGSQATASFSGPTVTLNDPINEALLVGNKDSSVAPTGWVQLATIALDVQGSGVTLISGDVIGLVTCDSCTGDDDENAQGLGAIIDGGGYVSLTSRRQRRGLNTPRQRTAPWAAPWARTESAAVVRDESPQSQTLVSTLPSDLVCLHVDDAPVLSGQLLTPTHDRLEAVHLRLQSILQIVQVLAKQVSCKVATG